MRAAVQASHDNQRPQWLTPNHIHIGKTPNRSMPASLWRIPTTELGSMSTKGRLLGFLVRLMRTASRQTVSAVTRCLLPKRIKSDISHVLMAQPAVRTLKQTALLYARPHHIVRGSARFPCRHSQTTFFRPRTLSPLPHTNPYTHFRIPRMRHAPLHLYQE